jgi:hypothetical protein
MLTKIPRYPEYFINTPPPPPPRAVVVFRFSHHFRISLMPSVRGPPRVRGLLRLHLYGV